MINGDKTLITIRRYKEDDTEALWNIYFHTVRNINIRDYSKEQVEAWAPDVFDMPIWKKRMQGLDPFVAVMNGVIVGYTDLQPNGLVDHFFCHHQYQGQGVGKALMNHVLRVGEQRKVKRFYSEVSITARPFYECFGFRVVQEQEMEVRGQMLRNFVMEKFSEQSV
ncbi:MAG: putative acetyltransferase [Marinomonas primoryensis]|jgi:putative acetyltransferase